MRIRRSCRLLLALSLLSFVAGCNYVHFGRPERFRTDAQLAAENSDLRVEKKLLQQELAIARKEGDALRAALDRPQDAAPELVARLNETTRELAELRASYARLQGERERLQAAPAGTAGDAGGVATNQRLAELQTRLGQTEEQLAQTLRTYTTLQEDNSRLRASIEAARAENATLTARVETLTAENQEARSAFAQLNTELLAQKEARAQAEQRAQALRAQLMAMVNATPAAPSPSLAAARESTATGAREIEGVLRTPMLAADSSAGAMLSVDTARLRAAQAPAPEPSSAAPATPAKPPRIYVVQPGDSLEKIAQKFYGRPDRWSVLYAANNALLSGDRPLTPGMELEIPEE